MEATARGQGGVRLCSGSGERWRRPGPGQCQGDCGGSDGCLLSRNTPKEKTASFVKSILRSVTSNDCCNSLLQGPGPLPKQKHIHTLVFQLGKCS